MALAPSCPFSSSKSTSTSASSGIVLFSLSLSSDSLKCNKSNLSTCSALNFAAVLAKVSGTGGWSGDKRFLGFCGETSEIDMSGSSGNSLATDAKEHSASDSVSGSL